MEGGRSRGGYHHRLSAAALGGDGAASAASDKKVVSTSPLAYPHNANQYAIPSDVPSDIGPANDPNITDVNRAVDTRAAVALLSRNIQIVSAGDLER